MWIWIHRIRVHHFKWIRIRIRNQGFDDKTFLKILPKFLNLFFIKICNLLKVFLGLHKGPPSYKRSLPSALKREHPALKKIKFINCFLFFWVIFALLDLDPDQDCESGSGSRDPIEYGSNPDPDTGADPDPQHWYQVGVKNGQRWVTTL